MFYDNEINNGGHLQYFHNEGMEQAEELLATLKELGAACQLGTLERALRIARENPVEQSGAVEDYFERAYEREFCEQDSSHYACRPDLGSELLPDYLHPRFH